jgi:hypothetical protein
MELNGRDKLKIGIVHTAGVVVAAIDVELGPHRCHAGAKASRGGLALCVSFELRPSQSREVEAEEVPEYSWALRRDSVSGGDVIAFEGEMD